MFSQSQHQITSQLYGGITPERGGLRWRWRERVFHAALSAVWGTACAAVARFPAFTFFVCILLTLTGAGEGWTGRDRVTARSDRMRHYLERCASLGGGDEEREEEEAGAKARPICPGEGDQTAV